MGNPFMQVLEWLFVEGTDRTLREEMSARLAELEERVRVLERIVTDERADLRRQFREL